MVPFYTDYEYLVEQGTVPFKYELQGDEAVITGVGHVSNNITIPPYIRNFNYNNPVLENYTPPMNVRIGTSTFTNLTSLTSITLSDAWTSTENGTTYMRGITTIGNNAFSGCTSLSILSIPASVTNIGSQVFNGCSNLHAINVNSSNPNYSSENGVLYNKNKTTLIRVPQKASGKFVVPDSVTSISSYAFSGCTNLYEVVLPIDLTSIGDYAFSSCTNLVTVAMKRAYYWAPTTLGSQAFSGCYNLNSIYLPSSDCMSAYQSMANWSGYVSKMKLLAYTGNASYEFYSGSPGPSHTVYFTPEQDAVYQFHFTWDALQPYFAPCLIVAGTAPGAGSSEYYGDLTYYVEMYAGSTYQITFYVESANWNGVTTWLDIFIASR